MGPDQIKQRRTSKGITQREISAVCGFTIGTVYQMETGRRPMSERALVGYYLCGVITADEAYTVRPGIHLIDLVESGTIDRKQAEAFNRR